MSLEILIIKLQNPKHAGKISAVYELIAVIFMSLSVLCISIFFDQTIDSVFYVIAVNVAVCVTLFCLGSVLC